MNSRKCLLFTGDVHDPRLSDFVKYPKRHSMLAIKEKCEKRKPFFFTCNVEDAFMK